METEVLEKKNGHRQTEVVEVTQKLLDPEANHVEADHQATEAFYGMISPLDAVKSRLNWARVADKKKEIESLKQDAADSVTIHNERIAKFNHLAKRRDDQYDVETEQAEEQVQPFLEEKKDVRGRCSAAETEAASIRVELAVDETAAEKCSVAAEKRIEQLPVKKLSGGHKAIEWIARCGLSLLSGLSTGMLLDVIDPYRPDPAKFAIFTALGMVLLITSGEWMKFTAKRAAAQASGLWAAVACVSFLILVSAESTLAANGLFRSLNSSLLGGGGGGISSIVLYMCTLVFFAPYLLFEASGGYQDGSYEREIEDICRKEWSRLAVYVDPEVFAARACRLAELDKIVEQCKRLEQEIDQEVQGIRSTVRRPYYVPPSVPFSGTTDTGGPQVAIPVAGHVVMIEISLYESPLWIRVEQSEAELARMIDDAVSFDEKAYQDEKHRREPPAPPVERIGLLRRIIRALWGDTLPKPEAPMPGTP